MDEDYQPQLAHISDETAALPSASPPRAQLGRRAPATPSDEEAGQARPPLPRVHHRQIPVTSTPPFPSCFLLSFFLGCVASCGRADRFGFRGWLWFGTRRRQDAERDVQGRGPARQQGWAAHRLAERGRRGKLNHNPAPQISPPVL